MRKKIYLLSTLLFTTLCATAQQMTENDHIRNGNQLYADSLFEKAEIEYRKAIVKDSLSVAANYNLAADLYRQNNSQEAQKVLDRIKDVAPASESASDYYYNLGDIAIANQDWQTAVTAFEESLLRNPADLDAKENYIYAKKKLQQQQQQQQNQQNNQNQNNQDNQNDQNQDQNQQNNDQNQDDKKDQDQQNDQNQDDKKDQDQQNDQNQNNDQNDQDQQQDQQPKITPHAAQQMLQAIQAKEKETQEKVKKEKAKALQSRQKDRNW